MSKFLAFIFVLLAMQTNAQTGTIKGTVTTSDGKPAEFVSVVIKALSKGATTNALGQYTIQNIPAGNYTLIASFITTQPVEKSIILKESETAVLDFTIDQSASELGEVVVTGQKRRTSTVTRTNTPLENIPISIQIVDEELMRQQQIIDTRDVIKNISGMTVTGTYSGGYLFLNSRGFNMNNWSNFRRNGMFIWNMGHHFNDNIAQVEVLKGPASVLYGDVAPGGIMNFVTKKPLNYNYKRFELKVGEYGLIRPTLDISGPVDEKGTLLYRLNATYEKSNSFVNEVTNEAVMLAPAFTWKIHPKLKWDVEATYKQDIRVANPGIVSPDGTFKGVKRLPVSTFLGEPSATYSFNDKSLFSTLNYFINSNWKIRNTTYYNYTTRAPQLFFLGAVNPEGETTRIQHYFNQWFKNQGTAFDVVGEVYTGKVKHQLLFGADYTRSADQYTDEVHGALDTTINIFNPKYGLSTLKADPLNWAEFEYLYKRAGFYVQDQISMFGEKLHALIGLRYNITSSGNHYFDPELEPEGNQIPVDKQFSPRFGLVYKPLAELSVYGSYTQSYEMNGSNWLDPTIAVAPTDASQVEVGVKTSLAEDRLGITVAAFQIDKKNIYGTFNSTTTPAFEYLAWGEEDGWGNYQGGHHRSKGIEMDLNGKLFEALSLNATYAFVDAEVIDDIAYEPGKQLEGNAKHSGSLWLNYAFQNKLKGLELGYGIFYKGKFYLSSANNPEELVAAYHSMDVSAGYTYKKFTARVNVTNLTNTIGYTGSYGVYEPLWVRRAVLSLAVKF